MRSKSIENKDHDDKLPRILSEKLYIDNNELAAEKNDKDMGKHKYKFCFF